MDYVERKIVKKPSSLKKKLITIILIFWIIPFGILVFFISISYSKSVIEKTENVMEESLLNFTFFHSRKIDEAITISKETSYEQVIEKAWKRHSNEEITQAEFYREVTGNLKTKYYNDSRFTMSTFYLVDKPEVLYNVSRKTLNQRETYNLKAIVESRKISQLDTTDTYVKVIDNNIYIIRNLYTTSGYQKFGTLVVELNRDKIFEGIKGNEDYEFGFYIDDSTRVLSYNQDLEKENQVEVLEKIKKEYSKISNKTTKKIEDDIYTGILYQENYDDYHLETLILANKNNIYSELDSLAYIVAFIAMIMIPVFLYLLYFIHKHITEPMTRMIKFSKSVERGMMGIQVDGPGMPNLEFGYLADSFNIMSSELEYMFEYAYKEKLARKEAKIIALQSQINPHFLNNTLEMMNWQARMSGNVEITKMISALGTLLDQSMDRSNKKLINLSEELRGVDAYFYIISMRFGKRLKIKKDIDESLLDVQVPQLILQPIIENAIVHGVEKVTNGLVTLKIFKEDENVILQVINTGKKMTEEDIRRIDRILNGRTSSEDVKGHVSLGIRNVNERIKLIYGPAYGLKIRPIRSASSIETESIITIPFKFDKKNNEIKDARKILKTK